MPNGLLSSFSVGVTEAGSMMLAGTGDPVNRAAGKVGVETADCSSGVVGTKGAAFSVGRLVLLLPRLGDWDLD